MELNRQKKQHYKAKIPNSWMLLAYFFVSHIHTLYNSIVYFPRVDTQHFLQNLSESRKNTKYTHKHTHTRRDTQIIQAAVCTREKKRKKEKKKERKKEKNRNMSWKHFEIWMLEALIWKVWLFINYSYAQADQERSVQSMKNGTHTRIASLSALQKHKTLRHSRCSAITDNVGEVPRRLNLSALPLCLNWLLTCSPASLPMQACCLPLRWLAGWLSVWLIVLAALITFCCCLRAAIHLPFSTHVPGNASLNVRPPRRCQNTICLYLMIFSIWF